MLGTNGLVYLPGASVTKKKCFNIETKEYVLKLFSSQLMNGPFKLECLSEQTNVYE
jgi:hypothetical protein